MTTSDVNDRLKLIVTTIITLSLLGIAGIGTIRGIDIGWLEPASMLVIGYWFGAGAQQAVAKASHTGSVPSVL